MHPRDLPPMTPREHARSAPLAVRQSVHWSQPTAPFVLYTTFTQSGSAGEYTATAYHLDYDRTSGLYLPNTSRDPKTIYDPGAVRGGTGEPTAPPALGIGDSVWATKRGNRWELISPAESVALRRFELKDTLTPGSNATAYLVNWTGAAYETDTDTEFEVYDALGCFRGRAKGAEVGSDGYAEWEADASRWEIIHMVPHALRISCTADGSVATTDSTFSVTGVTIMQPTGAILLDPVTTVYNVFSWAIDNGGLVHACWNESTEYWEAVQAECPA